MSTNLAIVEPAQTVIIMPQVSDEKGQSLLTQAQAIKIVDQPTYDEAANIFQAACAMETQLKADFEKPKNSAHKAHKDICDLEKKYLLPVQQAKGLLSTTIGNWDDEKERERKAEGRRLEEEARKRAEEEALAAAVEVEEAGGDVEEVEAILSAPVHIPVVSVAPTYQKAVSTTTRYWSEPKGSERAALLELAKAAVANPDAFLSCLLRNTSEIDRRARDQKDLFNVPGHVVRSETTATNRAAARR